jgi:hypothetical protein
MPLQLPPPVTRALLIACTVLLFLGAALRPLHSPEQLLFKHFTVIY